LFPLATSSILSTDDCWLGEMYAFSAAECSITLHNADVKPLHVELSTRLATVETTSLDIPAKGSAKVRVHVDVGNASGRVERTVRVHSERAADTTVWVRGFAINVLDNPRTDIQLGTVDASKPTETTVAVDSHDVANFRVMKVLAKPDGIDVAIDPSGRALRVKVASDAPLGVIDGDIKLAIDTPQQREAWLHVYADVRGAVAIDSTPYWFGTVAPGAGALIPLTSASGAPFRIGAVKLGMVEGRTEVVPCEPAASGCSAIRVNFDEKQPAGLTRATLDIELPDQHRKMHVRIWGLVQPAGVADDGAPLPAIATPDNSAPWTEGVVDSVNAPVYAVPMTVDPYDVVSSTPPPTTPPPGTGPLLKWQTASEGGVYGYQVFRGESENGPFLLQNEKILRAHAKQYAGTPYFWRDDHATKGTPYWYYVGVIYKDGTKQVLSSPHRKVAE
jgi:hypothetical protein